MLTYSQRRGVQSQREDFSLTLYAPSASAIRLMPSLKPWLQLFLLRVHHLIFIRIIRGLVNFVSCLTNLPSTPCRMSPCLWSWEPSSQRTCASNFQPSFDFGWTWPACSRSETQWDLEGSSGSMNADPFRRHPPPQSWSLPITIETCCRCYYFPFSLPLALLL